MPCQFWQICSRAESGRPQNNQIKVNKILPHPDLTANPVFKRKCKQRTRRNTKSDISTPTTLDITVKSIALIQVVDVIWMNLKTIITGRPSFSLRLTDAADWHGAKILISFHHRPPRPNSKTDNCKIPALRTEPQKYLTSRSTVPNWQRARKGRLLHQTEQEIAPTPSTMIHWSSSVKKENCWKVKRFLML